jgi:hypothetical protein
LIQHQLSHPERKGCVTVCDAFRDLIGLMAYSNGMVANAASSFMQFLRSVLLDMSNQTLLRRDGRGQGFCGSKVKSVLCPILRYKLPEAHKRLHVSASTLFYPDTLLRPQGSHSTRLDHRGEPEVLFNAMASDFF